MGNYDKKNIVKKAEEIIEDYSKKDRERRKENINIRREYKKLKRINIGLKVVIGILAAILTLIIL